MYDKNGFLDIFIMSQRRKFVSSRCNVIDCVMRFLDYVNPYAWVVALRNLAFDAGWLGSTGFDLPIVSVGNLTVGGTGKTPHIEYIINLLKDEFRVATLSRGYKRKSRGFVKAEAGGDVALVGDEPAQIKNKFPGVIVAVDEKRVDGIEHLLREQEQPDVVLLDDAFQHRYVTPGLSIVLVDYNRPVWRDCVLPFGRLREPAGGIERAHMVVVTKCPSQMSAEEMLLCKEKLQLRDATPLFFSTVCYDNPKALFDTPETACAISSGTQVLLLTGIARPEPLRRELERRGAVVTLMQYGDHHDFTSEELCDVEKRFRSLPGERKIILTTEKDAERLMGHRDLPEVLKKDLLCMPIKVRIMENENMFNQIILDYVRKNKRDRCVSAVGDEDKA